MDNGSKQSFPEKAILSDDLRAMISDTHRVTGMIARLMSELSGKQPDRWRIQGILEEVAETIDGISYPNLMAIAESRGLSFEIPPTALSDIMHPSNVRIRIWERGQYDGI